ncbi:DUF202 domain-containing protein [Mycobacterium sp. 4D054]|uniref:DUF202 domain-containing protein n=1 Tax=Mycobacterium sp. 4D054 TaxID=3457440 RepID=UPI003FD02AD5
MQSEHVVAEGDSDLLEPDYRFTLANERTFLAWQRTALGLLAAAVAVVQFLPELASPGLRHALGAAAAVVTGVVILIGVVRRRTLAARPRTARRAVMGTGAAVLILAALVVTYLVLPLL